MVKGVNFSNYRDTGDPVSAAKVYNAQYVDELVFIDIDATNEHRPTNRDIIQKVAQECFMPLTIGGGIKSVQEIRELLLVGADKVIINSAAYENDHLIRDGAALFGKQCIVIGIDVKFEDGKYKLYKHSGKTECYVSLSEHIQRVEALGAGEIFINNISLDGTMQGYDLKLINDVTSFTKLPVIACGGAGNFQHLAQAYLNTSVSGLAMASIFHFGDNNPIRARAFLKNAAVNIKSI
jgi:cyclase